MDPKTPVTKTDGDAAQWLFAVSLAGQLGLMIALPITVLALLGRLADKQWGTSPLFLLLGTAAAAVLSTAWILRRTRGLRERYEAVTGAGPRV